MRKGEKPLGRLLFLESMISYDDVNIKREYAILRE